MLKVEQKGLGPLGIGKQIQSISKVDRKIPGMSRQLPDASRGLQLGSHFKSVWPSKMNTILNTGFALTSFDWILSVAMLQC